MSDDQPFLTSGLGNLASSKSTLGSLAQSARTKHIKHARIILMFIGFLTIFANLVVVVQIRDLVHRQVQAEVQKTRGEGMEVDEEKVKELEEATIRAAEIGCYLALGVGILFVILGLFTRTHPVSTTVLGLVIYSSLAALELISGFAAGGGVAVVVSLGMIIKFIVIAVLAKAVRSAISSERERKEAASLAGLE
jgi:hypothetical protein